METIKIVILTDIQEVGFDIKSKIGSDNMAVVGFSEIDKRGVERVLSLYPHVVIIANNNSDQSFDIANEIYFNLPYCITILMCNNINISLMESAMSSGIKKVLDLNADGNTIRDCIKECYEIENSRKASGDFTKIPRISRVISVFGGKGGIGKTTIAVNVATGLAQKGKKVIIIDANLQMGDVHLHLDCDPKETLGELAYEANLGTIEILKTFITSHPSGINIIASPKSPEYSEVVRPEQFEVIINTLRPYYDYIIIDLPPSFLDTTITCFENSEKIILITGADISSLRGAKICMKILEKLRQNDKIVLILNKQTKGIISERDIERILGKKIDFKVSENSVIALQSLNKGQPIVTLFPKTPIGRDLAKISEGI